MGVFYRCVIDSHRLRATATESYGPIMKMRKGKIIALATGVGVFAVVLLMGVYWQNIAAWYRFVVLFERIGPNEQGYIEYRHRETGIVMVRLRGETFTMGSPRGEVGRREAELQHRVSLSPFFIAKYEVSQEEWQRVSRSNPSRFKGYRLPVENLSWNECRDFCTKTGLKAPTEAQWEYACRAGTESPFSFGDTITPEQANFNGEQYYLVGERRDKNRRAPTPIGSFQPNAFGIYDMHSNVSEFCEDLHDEGFYSKRAVIPVDPVCSESRSRFRVIRGGSWASDAKNCRSAARLVTNPSRRAWYCGVRPAYYPLP